MTSIDMLMSERNLSLGFTARADDEAGEHLGTIVQRAAATAHEMLGMDMSFIADTRAGRQHFVQVAGDGESFGAGTGESIPLQGTYCKSPSRRPAQQPRARLEP